MPKKRKKTWVRPRIARFTDATKVWEHFAGRGSAEERARLRALLDSEKEEEGDGEG